MDKLKRTLILLYGDYMVTEDLDVVTDMFDEYKKYTKDIKDPFEKMEALILLDAFINKIFI